MTDEQKNGTYQFLEGLHARLLGELLSPPEMRTAIPQIVAKAKQEGNKCLHGPEYAFLNGFAVPIIFSQMQTVVSGEEAKTALLSEWWNGDMRIYHTASPRRKVRHPFEKLPREPAQVLKRWRGAELNAKGKPRAPFHQPCPDLAWGSPFPHRVIFEVKYFPGGDAERSLVEGIYQTIYYLSMSKIPASATHPAWYYDYGCFLAFDASETGSLYHAWMSIPQATRQGFWDAANLFTMIIRKD